AWPSALAAAYWVLWRFEREWPPAVVTAWHAGSTWLLVFLAAWTLASAVDAAVAESDVWSASMWAAVPAAVMLALQRSRSGTWWPVGRLGDTYRTVVPAGL